MLVIGNTFTKLKYEVTEGACENFLHPEGSNGSYEGTLQAELVDGNISFS